MHSVALFQDWFKTINAQLGTSFELDDNGCGGIEFENDVFVYYQVTRRDEAIVLYSPVLSFEEPPSVPFLLGALTLNLHQQMVGRGALGYDPDSNALILSERVFVTRSSPEDLALRIDQFPPAVQLLRSELEAAAESAAAMLAGKDAPPDSLGDEGSAFSGIKV